MVADGGITWAWSRCRRRCLETSVRAVESDSGGERRVGCRDRQPLRPPTPECGRPGPACAPSKGLVPNPGVAVARSKKDGPLLVTRVHPLQRHRTKETCPGWGGSRLLPGDSSTWFPWHTVLAPVSTDHTSRPVPHRPGPEVAGWCPRGPGDRISK